MYAHKEAVGQPVFNALHAQQHHQRLLPFKIYFQIFAHALNIHNVGQMHTHHTVSCFQEHGVGLGCVGLNLRVVGITVFKVEEALHLEGGTHKLVKTEGLQQIVDGVHPKPLNGIFAISRGKHHVGCFGLQRSHKVDAVHIGHVDINKYKVYQRSV